MSDQLLAPLMPSLGLGFRQDDGSYICASQVVSGQLLEVDTSGASSLSTNTLTGSSSSRDVIVTLPTDDAAIGGRHIIVALKPSQANKPFLGRTKGLVRVLLFGVYTAGNRVVLQTGGDPVAGKRVLGLVLESGGAANMVTRGLVLWDGEMGFGQFVDEPVVPPSVPGGPDPPVEPDPEWRPDPQADDPTDIQHPAFGIVVQR